MKLWKTMGKLALSLAAVGMLVPDFARADVRGRGPEQAAVLDVQLRDGGVLVGQLLTAEGAPVRGEEISLRRDGQEVARATTDELGRYQVDGLRGGVYQVVTGEGGAAYRLWTANTAPPSAQPGALLITGDPVRGRLGGGGLLHNPWVLGGIAAGAIIGPIVATRSKSRPASP